MDEPGNNTFKLHNKKFLNKTKIKTNLKVMFTRLFTNNLLSSSLVSNSITYAKADTGASKTFIKQAHISKLQNIRRLQLGPTVLLPNNESLVASHQGQLQFNDCLSDTAKTAYVLPGMTNESLISIGQLCDDDCIAIFSKNDLNIFKNKKLVLQGKRNKTDGLWDVPSTPTIKNHAHSINSRVYTNEDHTINL